MSGFWQGVIVTGICAASFVAGYLLATLWTCRVIEAGLRAYLKDHKGEEE